MPNPRSLDPATFAQLIANAKLNGGLPRMCSLMSQVLRENGYSRGVEILDDYLLFERPFDQSPFAAVLCEDCGEEGDAETR